MDLPAWRGLCDDKRVGDALGWIARDSAWDVAAALGAGAPAALEPVGRAHNPSAMDPGRLVEQQEPLALWTLATTAGAKPSLDLHEQLRDE